MARFFDESWESCPHCKGGTFYERPLYSYKVIDGNKDFAVLAGVQIICQKCGDVLKTINKDTQRNLVVKDNDVFKRKYIIE